MYYIPALILSNNGWEVNKLIYSSATRCQRDGIWTSQSLTRHHCLEANLFLCWIIDANFKHYTFLNKAEILVSSKLWEREFAWKYLYHNVHAWFNVSQIHASWSKTANPADKLCLVRLNRSKCNFDRCLLWSILHIYLKPEKKIYIYYWPIFFKKSWLWSLMRSAWKNKKIVNTWFIKH